MKNTAAGLRGRFPTAARVAVALVAATVAVVVSMEAAGAGVGSKHPFNPWAGMSDQQKQALVDQTHSQTVKYLQEFEARHGDPRSLPVITVSTWQPPALSLRDAVTRATAIVHGNVLAAHFLVDAAGQPEMTATVSVLDVGAGPSIVVRQLGGPVARPGGRGALVRLEGEELILPGDEVVLLLTPSQATTLEYRAIYGAGVQFVRNGRFSGESAKRYGVDGQSFAGMWQSVTDPQLPVGAFPPRSSGD